MPRNHLPGPSTLRNRNRITNKSRLKIHHGNIDTDPLLIPDEDEEKHRLTNLVAGVDAEDANEHHLQAVLSAASQQTFASSRSTRGGSDKATADAPPAAYIPTPDSTGLVDNYEELYPLNRWKDPATYICTSTTVEESCSNALANGFTYYMDERDKDWLDKNNEEARGEGTSAQGAVSASSTRTSSRSAKSKGKEPESPQPVIISEDEFELVMGLFEKTTHEKTEFLHHGLEVGGMEFPPFSEYHDTFSNPLSPATFATFAIPTWTPAPTALVRIARAIYPYWKERRMERGGHRIIPVLNGDESDTLNESYICFRRREIKAVRKTRASQATSSDKLTRLRAELSHPLELAKNILSREALKKECAQQAQSVWEKRLGLVDLKRKYHTLGDKTDEDLLVDKERPAKRPEPSRLPGLKLRHDGAILTARPEVAMKPRDRCALIQEQIAATMQRQKDANNHWEDGIDNVYQQAPAPFSSRYFKFVPPMDARTLAEADGTPPLPRPVRLRYGRGGRMLVDRRHTNPHRISARARLFQETPADDAMEVDAHEDDAEWNEKLAERWRFDSDDGPAVGPSGSDEQDRTLVDDYDSKYLRHAMTLFTDPDQQSLMTDPSILVTNGEGRQQMVIPFRLGMPQPMMRRDASGVPRHFPPPIPPILSQGQQPQPHPVPSPSTNGTPVSMAPQMKQMPPPASLPHMRISSNGGMRPPGLPAPSQGNTSPSHLSPPHSAAAPQLTPPSANGINRPAINMPHIDASKADLTSHISLSNALAQPAQGDASQSQEPMPNGATHSSSPTRPKSQNQHTTNGFHLTPMSSYAASALSNNVHYSQQSNPQHSGLSIQQVQNLKSAFASIPPNQDMNGLQVNGARNPGPFMHVVPNGANFNLQLGAGANLNLKLPASRQVQWSSGGSPVQRPATVVNGVEIPIAGSPTPNINHSMPVRSPSANGSRPGLRAPGNITGLSTHNHQGPSPLPSSISQAQSPPRPPMTPTMTLASPSLQHQQPVGSGQNGY
ncbi:enhancer of polycomb-like-domain-containing protein [Infundibulicybe gibba]|nr:enhancer of polycomb-like-domain-containing protein [Infundibulicybe gibba]